MTDLPFPNVELPTGNYLRPNGHGGYLIRQSDLSSFARCGMQKYYQDRANNDPDAPQGAHLSATGFGTVMHFALQHMEQAYNAGNSEALNEALNTFEYYWHPDNMGLLGVKVDTWIKRQTWAGLRERGRAVLRAYYDMQRHTDTQLLACEYQFAVPMPINGRLHTLTGTIDRLEVGRLSRKPYLKVTDYKSDGSRPGSASRFPRARPAPASPRAGRSPRPFLPM